jgi:basic membrane protein A
MRRSRLAPLAAGLATVSLVVAGTASAQSPSAGGAGGAAPLKIGVVTDVGQLEDRSFNQFSNQGAIDAATELGGTHDVIVTKEIADYANNIQTFVDQDYDVIVTIGFLIGSDTLAAATANPDVHFIGVDQGICVDETGANDPTFTCAGDAASLIPNYQGILFKEAQPGYLVGIVAGTLSESGTRARRGRLPRRLHQRRQVGQSRYRGAVPGVQPRPRDRLQRSRARG